MKRLKTFLLISRLTLVHSATTAELFSFLLYCGGRCLLLFSNRYACAWLIRSHRNSRLLERRLKIERLLTKHRLFQDRILEGLLPPFDPIAQRTHSSWIFKLKEPDATEKGVLLIKFNDTFEKLGVEFDIARLLDDYYLVLEPSYSGFCTPEILQFLKYGKTSIVVQASEQMDYDFLERLDSNLVPVNFGPQDWNDDRVFTDLGLERKYDCVMVAMWNDVKRHHVLFRAVAEIADPTYRVALAGNPWNMSVEDIRDMVRYYRIERNVEIFESYGPSEVNELYNQSKVNVLLSLREGSNKSICEGLFANLPAIVLVNNLGVNKSYFAGAKGMLINEKDLKDALLSFRVNYDKYRPREWAIENISCPVTTAKLEKKLKEIARGRGEPWTRPIAVKVNRGSYPSYYYEHGKLSPFEGSRYRRAQ